MADEQKLTELLDGSCPAVLTTYRPDGSVSISPVWVGLYDGAFEVVMAAKDGKVRSLRRDLRCLLVMFKARPPFRESTRINQADRCVLRRHASGEIEKLRLCRRARRNVAKCSDSEAHA